MINNSLIKIIDFWQEVTQEKNLYDRQLVDNIDIETKEVIDIIGPRRSGKSSIMKIIIQKLKVKEGFLYINFEDPYFIDHNTPMILEELVETYKEYYQPNLTYLFFPEGYIQVPLVHTAVLQHKFFLLFDILYTIIVWMFLAHGA